MNRRNKRRLIVVATLAGAVVLVGVGGTFVRQANRERIAQTSLEEGLAAYEQGDYRTTFDRLRIYVRYDDQNAEALVALGDARRNLEEVNARHLISARSVLEQAVQVARANGEDSHEIRGLNMLMDIHVQLGNWRELAEVSTTLLEKQPDNLHAARQRIEAHLNRGSNDDAIAATRELVEREGGTIESHLEMVSVLTKAGRPPRELREYIENVIAPAHAGSTGLAVIQAGEAFDAGRVSEAREMLVQTGESGPTDGIGAQLLLEAVEEIAASTGDYDLFDLSEDWLDQWLANEDLAPALLEVAAGRAWRQGQADRALELAQRAIEVDDTEESVFAWGLLGAIDRGQLDQEPGRQLQAAFDAAIEPHARYRAETWRDVIDAYAAQRLNKQPESDRGLLSGMTPQFVRGPDGVAAYVDALTQAERNYTQEAIVRLTPMSRQPSWRRARLEQVRMLLSVNRPSEAFSLAVRDRSFIQSQAGAALFGDALASTAEQSGSIDLRLVDQLDVWLKSNPQNPMLLAAVGRSALVRGELDRARELGERLAQAEAADAAVAALRLAGRFEPTDSDLARSIVDRIAQTATRPLEFAAAAVGMAQQGRIEDARALIERESAGQATGEWSLARVQLANIIDDEQSLSELETVSSENAQDARVQVEILAGSVIWSYDQSVGRVIARLREAEGDNGVGWRIFEARRLLRTDAGADAARNASQLFEPVFQSESGRRNTEAMLVAADAFARTGATENELRALQNAADGDEPLRALPRLIDRLQATGDSEAAESRLLQFAEFESLPRELRLVRISLLERQGLSAMASRDIEALAAQGEPRFILRRGIMARPSGLASPLTDEEQQALESELSPQDEVFAARLLARVGREADGLARLEGLPQISEAGSRAVLIARYLRGLGRTEDALTYLTDHARATGDADAWMEAARLLVGNRQLDEAKALLDEAALALPENSAIMGFRASLDNDRAQPMFDRMAQFTVSSAEREDATDDMQSLAEISGRYIDGQIDLAQAAQQLDAIARQRATLYPVWPLLIAAYEQLGQDDAAVQRALAAANALPQDHRPARDATQLLIRVGRFPDALGVASQWRSLAPDASSRTDAELALGVIEYARGNAQRAIALINPHVAALLAQPQERAMALRTLAEALAATDQMERAEELLMPLAQNDTGWAGFMASSAVAAPPSEANIQRAVRWLETVGPLLERDARGASYVASSWMVLAARAPESGFARRAVDYAETVVQAGGDSWELQAAKATAHESLDEPAEAVAAYERSLNMADRRIPPLLNNAAWVYTSSLGNHDRAIELAREATELASDLGVGRGNRAIFHHTLGKALMSAGRNQEALDSFEAGLQLAETTSLRLGRIEALLAVGRRSEAAVAYGRLRPTETWTETQRARFEALEAVLGSG